MSGNPVNLVITGASSGLGRALALLYAKRGGRLVLAGRDTSKLEEVKAAALKCGACAVATFAGDLSTEEANAGLLRVVTEALNGHRIHYVILNAGTGAYGAFSEMADPLGTNERLLRDNYWTVVYGVRVFQRHLREASSCTRLAVTSAVHAIQCEERADTCMSLFAASKSAVEGFVDSLRKEECYGISVAYPAAVCTPFYDRMLGSGKRDAPTHSITAEKAACMYAHGLDKCCEHIYLDTCTRTAHFFSGWVDTLAQILMAHSTCPTDEGTQMLALAQRYQAAGICSSSSDMHTMLVQEMSETDTSDHHHSGGGSIV